MDDIRPRPGWLGQFVLQAAVRRFFGLIARLGLAAQAMGQLSRMAQTLHPPTWSGGMQGIRVSGASPRERIGLSSLRGFLGWMPYSWSHPHNEEGNPRWLVEDCIVPARRQAAPGST